MFITSKRTFTARKYLWEQVFTSSVTWTCPTTAFAKIQVWGGGAAGSTRGSGSEGSYVGGYGGEGGDYAEISNYHISKGSLYTIVVGNRVNDGTARGSGSYFITQSLVCAAGGTGGDISQDYITTGSIFYKGGAGGTGSFDKNDHEVGGGGGGSAFYNGNGQAGQSYSGANTPLSGGLGQGIGGQGKVNNGGDGGNWPGGGGGARSITVGNLPVAGGWGESGAVVITWYEFSQPTVSYIPSFVATASML